jgi:hypothetical protein
LKRKALEEKEPRRKRAFKREALDHRDEGSGTFEENDP